MFNKEHFVGSNNNIRAVSFVPPFHLCRLLVYGIPTMYYSFTIDNIRFKSLQLRSGTCEIYTDLNYYGQHSRKPASTIVAIDETDVIAAETE